MKIQLGSKKVFSLLLTIVFIISMGLIIYFYFKTIKLQNNLQEQKNTLKKQRDTLQMQKSIVADSKREFVQEVEQLLKNLDKNGGDLNLFVSGNERLDTLVKKVINSKYIINISCYKGTQENVKKLVDYLQKNGYYESLPRYNFFNNKPSWMSSVSTVLYYSKDSKEKADLIAKELKRETNINFITARGSGLGVITGQEKWTINIHYINDH